MDIYYELLANKIKEENILLNEPMSKHTSFKAGGNADFFIKAYSVEEVRNILKVAKENQLPWVVIGNGTNILVKEEGYHGIVMQIQMDKIHIEGLQVTADCGVKNSALAHKLAKNDLAGFEFALGIPGTIGGAIKMNAGAYGSEMKDIVKEVTYLDKEGILHTIKNEDCNFSYRKSIFFKEKAIILQAKLQLQQGKEQEIENKMQELQKQRKEKQPLEYPNAGSTFKRGENYITAQLIDECGLKGYQIGGAQVSEKHAGFIINKGNATATDILELIAYVQKIVKEKTGNQIQLEIEVIGG